jgi:tRNA-Thr(GGU) m(6)t(6)A37 methyltransferase TsaA
MDELRAIGVLRTCWPDRWGVPRQAGLVPEAWGELVLESDIPGDALRGLDSFSHAWLLAILHGVTDVRFTVRPPRLGGSARRGVFATRSPHRPSRLALSAVRIVEVDPARRLLRVAGHDLLDGTPIVDIKPYLPWADAIPTATAAWADAPPEPVAVRFTDEARAALPDRPHLEALITSTLAADPRQGTRDWTRVSVRVEDLDVHARDEDGVLVVHTIAPWAG